MGARSIFLASVVLASFSVALSQTTGFLLISAPVEGRVSWVRLPEDDSYEGLTPTTLIDSGLRFPQGIAVDQQRKLLYVTDPDARKIYSYRLKLSEFDIAIEGEQTVVCHEAESRWIAVDGVGNVFFSDEPRNLILTIPAAKAQQSLRGGEATVPEVVFTGSSISAVNDPGGIAVDNFHVYWTNKHWGTQVGSVVRGSERPASSSDTGTVSVLARNVVKSYGICLALDNIYYTDSEKFLYGVKKSGGPATEVSSQLQHPRGCAWDGDGTVYVADRKQNAVFAFASNMHKITGVELRKVFDIEDAFGLAVAVAAGSPRDPTLFGAIGSAVRGMFAGW